MLKVVILCSLVVAITFAEPTWDLIVNEGFNGTGAPNADVWDYELGYIRNHEKQWYTNSTENVFQKDGNLVIKAIYKEGEQHPLTSGSIFTKKSYRYGRFEARMKVPLGLGTWPAFWMLGEDINEVGWPWCGEIDIMESVGFDPDVVHGTFHTEVANSMRGNQVTKTVNVSKLNETWHMYFAEWTPERVTIGIDDKTYVHYDNDHKCDSSSWPYNKGFQVKLNFAIGGAWGGLHGINYGIFPVSYLIDYVKIYEQRNPTPTPFLCKKTYNYMTINTNFSYVMLRDTLLSDTKTMTQIYSSVGAALKSALDFELNTDSTVEVVSVGVLTTQPSQETLLLNFSLVNLSPSEEQFAKVLNNQSFVQDVLVYFIVNSQVGVTQWNVATLSSKCSSCYLPLFGSIHESSPAPVPMPWHRPVLPANIPAVDYDFGGPNVAYADTTVWNQNGDTERALPDWVDIDALYAPNNLPRPLVINFINKGEWLKYSTLVVQKTSTLFVSLEASNGMLASGQVLVHFRRDPNAAFANGTTTFVPTEKGETDEARWFMLEVPHTGSWNSFERTSVIAMPQVVPGTYTMTLYFMDSNLVLKSINLELPEPAGDDKKKDTDVVAIIIICAIVGVVVVLGGIIKMSQKRKLMSESSELLQKV